MSQCKSKSTIRLVRPAKTQISMYIHRVWKGFTFLFPVGWPGGCRRHVRSQKTLTRVFAVRTSLIIDFVVRSLNLLIFFFTHRHTDTHTHTHTHTQSIELRGKNISIPFLSRGYVYQGNSPYNMGKLWLLDTRRHVYAKKKKKRKKVDRTIK